MRTKRQLNRSQRASRVLAALALCCLVIACISGTPKDTQPRQGWWIGNGIVVPHDSFPTDCRLCHVEGSWNEIRDDFEFDHLAETGYALEGKHADAKCLRCHNDRGPVQMFEQRGCWGCHQDVHRGNFGATCTSCHTPESWIVQEQVIEHNRTRFPLVGSHAAVQCWACHPGGEVGNWSRVDIECITCHADDLAVATSPDHQANGWVQSCDRCHIPTTWDGAGFNHASFPLTGAHRSTDCSDCHVGDVFVGLPTTCFGCHEQDFQDTDDPDHVADNFPTSCELCHNTSDWDGAMFNHASITANCSTCHLDDYQDADDPDHVGNSFPLTCELCHDTRNWDGAMFSHQGISTGCATCHSEDYQNADDPDHVAGSFSMTCELCHDTRNWEGAMFSHAGIRSGCSACHMDDYNGTTDPNHSAKHFSTSCEDCHNTKDWDDATFSHRGITTGCSACHLDDYATADDPPHAAGTIPTNCEMCHDPNSWDDASFSHSGITASCTVCHGDKFDITRSVQPDHQAAGISNTNCDQCHSTNTWSPVNMSHVGIVANCQVCHMTDYNQTTSPSHSAAGFPTSCQACHGTNNWTPATFSHSFPITSGDHAGFDCADCHTQPRNYQVFSCIDCHEHRQSEMDDEHDEERGYSWNSMACYSCHPNGQD